MTGTSELPNTKASATPAITEPTETANSTVAEPKEVVSISTESEAPGANASAFTALEMSAVERKKAKSRAANRAAVELICETYPQTFSFVKPRPLKIGIQEELVADAKLSQTKIKRGLASYVRAFGYLKSQTDGAPRINLLGEADGAVTADEAAHALTKLPATHKARPSVKKRPDQAATRSSKNVKPKAFKPESKIKKAASPFDGLNDGQRMASKLELLLKKNSKT